jgi:hypothetical protein
VFRSMAGELRQLLRSTRPCGVPRWEWTAGELLDKSAALLRLHQDRASQTDFRERDPQLEGVLELRKSLCRRHPELEAFCERFDEIHAALEELALDSGDVDDEQMDWHDTPRIRELASACLRREVLIKRVNELISDGPRMGEENLADRNGPLAVR